MLKHERPIPELSPRESQVARKYAFGMSHTEIAQELCVAPSTVRTHISAIFRKLEVSSKLELMRSIEAIDLSEQARAEPPLTGSPPRGIGRVRKWLALAVCACLVAGAATLLIFGRNGPAAVPRTVPVAFDGPSIAVMPIDINAAPADDRAVLAAINRDIVTDLSQFSDIVVVAAGTTFRPEFAGQPARVIGRDLGVRYVLAGGADWRGDRLTVNLRLIETETSQIVWSERFETTRQGLLDFQTKVATRVIGIIGPVGTGSGHLREVELSRIQRRATDVPSAFDKFVEGMVHFERFTQAENARARALFHEAIAIDPNYGKAYAMAAWSLVRDVWNQRVTDPRKSMAEARALLDRGFQADPNEPYMHWALGAYHLFQADHQRSIAAFRKAVELNPNGADLRTYLGWAMVYAGEPEAGLRELEIAQKLNPRHPGWYLWDIAFAKTFIGDYDGAAETLEAREPRTAGTHELLAVIYALNGEDQKAAAAVDRLLQMRPDYSIASRSMLEPFARDEDREKYFSAMSAAGIPAN